jgi:cysteinyl-tRNA synthetase
MLRIYNVLTDKKDIFKPQNENEVLMYACGITVSGDAHIGHAYQAIIFDMIKKYLEFKGYNVKYVRNYTDVDDKIINKANELNINPMDYAKEMMIKTDKELQQLNIDLPKQCLATEHITDMIEFIEKLIDKKVAYTTDKGDVYFSAKDFPNYGKFSNNTLDETIAGVRKEIEDGKRDESDFALWKKAREGEPFWKSPWGNGRPGWHIECSAMSMKHLGETLDIHGGGKDLKFPHHENEIAQSEALTGKQFAKYWIHNGLIKINGQKMSKSLGNSILLEDLLEKYHHDAIRLTLLQNKYNSDMNIINGMFEQSEKKIYNIYTFFKEVDLLEANSITDDSLEKFTKDIRNDFEETMDIDFNTALALSKLLKYISNLRTVIKENKYNLAKHMKKEIISIYKHLGILQDDPDEVIDLIINKHLKTIGKTRDEIDDLIKKINELKADKNYKESDKIRKQLIDMNILVQDTKIGTTWDIKMT